MKVVHSCFNSYSLLCSHSAEAAFGNVSKSLSSASMLSCDSYLSWSLNSIEMMDYFFLCESLSSLGFLQTSLSSFYLSFTAFSFSYILLAALLFLSLCTLPFLFRFFHPAPWLLLRSISPILSFLIVWNFNWHYTNLNVSKIEILISNSHHKYDVSTVLLI